jgi:hypothetical protein
MYVTYGEAGRIALNEELDIAAQRLEVLKTEYLGM